MQRRGGLDYELPEEICDFCYFPEERPILYADEHVYITPTLGHFIDGYLLMNHQNHVDCYGEVANNDIRSVMDRIRVEMTNVYGSCSFFEHGRTGNCYSRRSDRICYHAHIHCMPIKQDLSAEIEEELYSIELDNWTDIHQLYDSSPHYLYYENNAGEMYFYPVEQQIERQYLRKRACEALDIPIEQADWQKYPHRERMFQTGNTLERLFEKKHENVA